MKYDIDVSVKEIQMRSKKLIIDRQKKTVGMLSALSFVIFCILTVSFYSMADVPGTAAKGSFYGAFLISKETGGFVLIGVICFVLGVCVATLIGRRNGYAPRFTKETIYGGKEEDPND